VSGYQKIGEILMNRYKIVENSIIKGTCSKNHSGLVGDYHTHVVKVIDKKTGTVEYRCNKHVRSLSDDNAREIAHELTNRDTLFWHQGGIPQKEA